MDIEPDLKMVVRGIPGQLVFLLDVARHLWVLSNLEVYHLDGRQ